MHLIGFFLSLFIHIFAQNQNSDTELKQHEEKDV